MLRARDVSFRYSRRGPWVVRGLDLTLEVGEVVGISGRSGIGKTTLARLLTGYLRPDRGSVDVDGEPLSERTVSPVQLLFQNPELSIDPRWRLRETLAEAGPLDVDLLGELSIHPSWLTRFPHELSGGELQRIAVARALLAQPTYVVADEISSMLDPVTQAQLWHSLRGRAGARQLGVLAITHDIPLLRAVADRIIELPG